MYRRIALATAACALALPASTLASEPAATGAGSVGVQPASGLKVTSVKASKSGRTVTAKVRWDRALLSGRGGKRFHLRLLAHSANGHTRQLAALTRSAGKGAGETVTLRLSKSAARLFRASSRVTMSVTQQFDTRSDSDRLYERNQIAIRSVKGKSGAPQGPSCSGASVDAGGKVTGECGLQGAFLANADLRGVSLAGARLDGGSLAGADLRSTDLTGTSLVNVSTRGAVWSAAEQEALTLPDSGQSIASAIDGAKSRVDIVIYTIGGPEIVGQASKPGALMRAVNRGVDVRIIVNSGNKGCKAAPPDQQSCLTARTFDPLYAIQQSLTTAQQNPLPPSKGGTGKAGNFEIRFSSQNFQITHQKTILIDAFDKTTGQPSVGATSLALVSTGNLDSYGVGSATRPTGAWGSSYANPNFLTDPASSCGGTGCPEDWAARDFAIAVTDQALIQRIASVYASDANCETWASSPVYSKLVDSTMADSWANGTLLSDGSSYPSIGTPAFYGSAANPQLQATPQGNSRSRQLRLIDSAQKSLIVYNEEMADPDIMNALVRASRERKVDVSVVMSEEFCSKNSKKKQPPCVDGQPLPSSDFDYLTANGVKVMVMDKQNSDTGAGLYIHAKAIVADGTDGFIGSENFGFSSMNYNRELGLMLTNRADPTTVASGVPSIESVSAIAQIQSAFAADSVISTKPGSAVSYNTSKVYPSTPPPVQTYPMPPVGSGTAYPNDFNLGCGPVQPRPKS